MTGKQKDALIAKMNSLIRTAQAMKLAIQNEDIDTIDGAQNSLHRRIEEFDYNLSLYGVLTR